MLCQHHLYWLNFRNRHLGCAPFSKSSHSLQGLKEKQTYHRLHLIKSLKATFTKHILRVSIQGWTFPGTLASFRVFIPRWRTTLCGRLSHTVSSSIAELAAIPEAMRYIVTQPPCNRCVFFFLIHGVPLNPFRALERTTNMQLHTDTGASFQEYC